MKNIELIDKAIDDLGGEFKPAGNYVVIEERMLAIAHINANLQPICTRAEFLARKAERQNKPDWNDHDYNFIQQGKNGQWYGSKSYSPPALPDYLTGDDWHYINIASGRHGEVIGDCRDTLERRPDHIGEANEKAVTEADWPDEKRIDVIGTNGNTGESYRANQPKTAADYLAACANVQLERGRQYDASGTGERSFDAAAEAFNCVTGKNLRGSDVCLILEMVKLVRQYSDPTRLHADSVLDKVSYSALWAEQITAELGK